MIKKVLVLATCMVFLLAGMAQAEYLYLEGTGADFTGVTIHDPALTSGATAGTTAGRFTVDFGPSSSDFQKYQAFCVDYANVYFTTAYSTYIMIDLPGLLPYKQAAYIYENFAYANPSAAQLAIWEVVFEGLSGGSVGDLETAEKFYGTNINPQDLLDAQSYVTAALANGANFSNTSSYKLLVSPSTATSGYYGVDQQDFLVRVPEPGVLTLLGLGLVALGITRRRSK
jgi:hypothetical protein